MLRIGNDVVDVEDAANAAAPARERFLRRVCTAEEVERVRAAADAVDALWCLFAAKEAAYKALATRDPDLVFAHRAFAVAEDLCSVTHGADRCQLWLARGPGWVHAVAIAGGGERDACPDFWVAEMEEGADASEAVRALLCASVAPRLGCSVEHLAVVRDERPGSWTGYGPPRLVLGGMDVDMDVSLSHDGRFVAAAALLGG